MLEEDFSTFANAGVYIDDAADVLPVNERRQGFVQLLDDELVVLGVPLHSLGPISV